MPQENGRYLLLDGQLRTEAAKLLGWATIRALVVPMPFDLNSCALQTFVESFSQRHENTINTF